MQKPAFSGFRPLRIPKPTNMGPAWSPEDFVAQPVPEGIPAANANDPLDGPRAGQAASASALAPASTAPASSSGPAAASATVVDFATLEAEIIAPGGERARRSYASWLARADRDARYVDIQTFVHGLKHAALFKLTLDEVERVTTHPDPTIRTGHALGDIRPAADCIREVDDFDTPWALQYLLHGLLERRGSLPRWEDFDRFLRKAARARYYGPFTEQFRYDQLGDDAIRRFERALQWRTGNAYYSFLREVDLLTRLRVQYGLPVRYHVLADAQFKIDLWCENVLVAVFIKNPRYRQGAGGRKERVQDRMDVGAFTTLELELEAPTRFGRPSLVTPADVRRAAEAIRAALASR